MHKSLRNAAALAALVASAAGAAILPDEPAHSPFAYIRAYLVKEPGQPECYINEGYLNFTQDWIIDPAIAPTPTDATAYLRRWDYALGSQRESPDVTRSLLRGLDALPGQGARIHVAVSAADCDGCRGHNTWLRQTLPRADLHLDLPADRTHGKSLQCSNGRVYLTQNGSVNMQTVGVTTKANNSLVFVETGTAGQAPPMYRHFRDLWHAVVNDSGTAFDGGATDSSGLAGMVAPARIGERLVYFYAGRRNAFVGPTWTDGGMSRPFPDNLYPPAAGELRGGDLTVVNWYDQILLDAGTRLASGDDVTVDLYMFEIGRSNPFIDNLARFVQYGFVDCPVSACPTFAGKRRVAISKRPDAVPPVSDFPGRLAVNVYYQFQQGCTPAKPCRTPTYRYLNQPIAGGSPNYTMQVKRVWQGFTGSAMPGNPAHPATPQDMHLKVAVLTAEYARRLYVATSNLDMPNVGSGRKWQAGNIVELARDDPLYALYQPFLRSIADDGDRSQQLLGRRHAQGNSHFDAAIGPGVVPIEQSGIAAFIFPLDLE